MACHGALQEVFGLKLTPKGAESRAQPAAPSAGRPAACRFGQRHAKPLSTGVCSLHKVNFTNVGSADPGPPLARA